MHRAVVLAGSAAFAALVLVTPATAQHQPPTGWKWLTDAPATLVTEQQVPEEGWRFVAMPPGWHITMGPGGILYHPAYILDDRFVVETELILFPSEGNSGYGAFVGGSGLEADAASYVAFLIRGDGSAGIFRHTRDTADPLVPWTRHEAVLPGKADGTVKNVVRIEAERDRVVLRVNGAEVASIERDDLPLAGHVGLRIGKGLNLHTTNLDLTHRLAPTPPGER